MPGHGEPEQIYVSPHPDAVITDVVGSPRGYAFVETSAESYGDGGWRIWFLAEPGGVPTEVDRGQAPGAGAAPTIDMDNEHIAWAAFDEPSSGPVSRLRAASIDILGNVTTLIDQPIERGLLWYPALDADEVWYGIIDVEATSSGDEFHIESLSLVVPGSPVRFAGTGNDFNPAVNEHFVVWKTAEGDSAALNWGTVRVQNRETSGTAVIPVPDANRPSIGDRFVTFEEITHSRLAVYDPVADELFDLIDASDQAEGTVGGQSLDGGLLTFFTQETATPRVGWALLPS